MASAQQRLLERFPTLSPRLQTAARYVVDHPSEVVVESMRTLAHRAGAQPATLVRLAQQLGYAGWPELKSDFAEDLGLQGGRYGSRARSVAVRGRHADLAGEFFSAQHANLAATEAQCADELRDVASLLARAPAVHIAGFRASHPVAFSLFYGYRLFRNSVHLIDGQPYGIEAQLRQVERDHAVVVVSFAPYSRETLLVLERSTKVGAHIIAVTDSRAAPQALSAEHALIFSARSPSFFPSVAAAVALTEALLEQLVAIGGGEVVASIESAERQLFECGAYVTETARRPIRG